MSKQDKRVLTSNSVDIEIKYPVILFDGVCNLCQATVQFVIKNDSQKKFRFASLQSDFAQCLLYEVDGVQDHSLSSVILVVDGNVFRKSKAALNIMKRLDLPWPLAYWFLAWLPSALLDVGYSFIGKRRYLWFGKKKNCWVPSEELSKLFLD